jgi:acyl-CoA synthetase (AMP-forming)/AMP-acid ligase II
MRPGIRQNVKQRLGKLPVKGVADGLFTAKVMAEVGVLRPIRPDRAARALYELRRWGPCPAAGSAVTAIVHPDDTAIVDEAGRLSFGETFERTNALANSWRQAGIGPGDGVAIMCRDHRGFIEATVAASKLGANVLYLNTAFAAPQIRDVIAREQPTAIVYDEEFAGLLEGAGEGVQRFVAWSDDARGAGHSGEPTLEELIAAGARTPLAPPAEPGRFVILTSGTTGTPKGAQRAQPDGLGVVASLFSKIPLRTRRVTVIAAPLFHSWGFSHFLFGCALGSTFVLRRRFDPEETLRAVAEHEADALVAVPVMIQRILELPEETLARYSLPSLRVTALSGSALPGDLATAWMDRFGDNLYNLYGSTEVAWATIATPEDLRAAPGTAGKPPRGTVVKIVDEAGRELAQGETGRIFVGNEMAFEGYTGGGDKERIEGLLSSGDVGHFDEGGRLFIDGRDDEMIVSGGENVFPREVEDLLADHDAVLEAAVVGVPDDQFGQRLKAFVVTAPGASFSDEDVKSYVKANLARFKVPREVVFMDELPRNPSGKVLKRELTGA